MVYKYIVFRIHGKSEDYSACTEKVNSLPMSNPSENFRVKV